MALLLTEIEVKNLSHSIRVPTGLDAVLKDVEIHPRNVLTALRVDSGARLITKSVEGHPSDAARFHLLTWARREIIKRSVKIYETPNGLIDHDIYDVALGLADRVDLCMEMVTHVDKPAARLVSKDTPSVRWAIYSRESWEEEEHKAVDVTMTPMHTIPESMSPEFKRSTITDLFYSHMSTLMRRKGLDLHL